MNRFCPEKAVGTLCIIVGLACNEFVLGWLFCADGKVTETHDRVFILLFEIFLLFTGMALWSKLELKQLLQYYAMMVLTLVTIELSTQAVCYIYPRADWVLMGRPEMLIDYDLGYRLHPGHPDHDKNGYRNPTVPEDIDIVTLGDSQTYGIGVSSEEKWSSVLGKNTNKSVYNISCPGWGPIQPVILLDEVRSLNPKTVILALYSGNDIYDAFDQVWIRGRREDFRSPHPHIQEGIRKLQMNQTFEEKVMEFYLLGEIPPDPVSSIPYFWKKFTAPIKLMDLIGGLSNLVGANGKPPESKVDDVLDFAQKRPEYFLPFRTVNAETIFEPQLRYAALDFHDKRVEEGYEITLKSIDEIDQKLRLSRIDFIVLLIPTKEYVFKDMIYAAGISEGSIMDQLIRNESDFWRRMKADLVEKAVPYIDAMPTLQAFLEKGTQSYQKDYDGHPNVLGHQAIAKAVAREL